ncbi:hypothetical protein CR513_27912, partial [Mucuna pruriens]
MVSVEAYPTWSRLSADRHNRVGLTLFRAEIQGTGGLKVRNNQVHFGPFTPITIYINLHFSYGNHQMFVHYHTNMQSLPHQLTRIKGVNSTDPSSMTIVVVKQRWFTSISQNAEDRIHQILVPRHFEIFNAQVDLQLEKKSKAIKSDRNDEYYGRYDVLGEQRSGNALNTKKPLFFPISSKDSFRTIMILVAHFNLEFHRMNCKLKTVSDDSKFMLCKLKKSIYGLKNRLPVNCLTNFINGCKYISLVLYVDDILFARNDIGLLHETRRFLTNNF